MHRSFSFLEGIIRIFKQLKLEGIGFKYGTYRDKNLLYREHAKVYSGYSWALYQIMHKEY